MQKILFNLNAHQILLDTISENKAYFNFALASHHPNVLKLEEMFRLFYMILCAMCKGTTTVKA